MLDFRGSGMSIMEQSHRGAVYDAVHEEALVLVRQLMQVPDTHEVLFLQGGASAQFALVPMNLRPEGRSADYLVTGVWGKKAIKEAQLTGLARLAGSTEEPDGKFLRVPRLSEFSVDPQAAYFHLTSNNTIMGTQLSEFPSTGEVPLVVDMSSDILARPIDVSKCGLIYAGAQKNLGPSGVTVLIMRRDLIESGRRDVPYIFQYRTQYEARSLANTVNTFGVYMLRNVLAWVQEQGGMVEMKRRALAKSAKLYAVLEERSDIYKLTVEPESRSSMNVVWNLKDADAEKACVAAATAAGFVGLKGHRIVGGLRASIYNAVPDAAVDALCEFLRSYQ
jgi:phosphoserine aminotransferase